MRIKGAILAVIAILFIACNDDLNTVGTGTMPDEDRVHVYTDTIYPDAKTIKIDSIYAKTVNGLLGNFTDPMYGTLKADYVCQFYTSGENVFPDTIVNSKIDSITLNIYYSKYSAKWYSSFAGGYLDGGWVGDSLAPMVATIYPVKKDAPLNENYYTNVVPAKYADLATIYGTKAYTARDLTIPDSVFNASNYLNSQVKIKLPTDLGQKIYNEWKKNPSTFSTLDKFNKFFPGLYVTTTMGSGNILNVAYTRMFVHFNMLTKSKLDSSKDSIINGSSAFSVSKEVIQLNQYKSTNDAKLLVDNTTETYLKTPAGIFTQYTIPIPEIAAKQKNRKFNSVKLTVSALPNDDWQYKLNVPPTLLLIPKDSLKTFFEKPHVANSKTSYTSSFSNYSYNFNNIASLIEYAIENKSNENLEILLVPVTVVSTTYTDSYYGQTYTIPYTTSHYLLPSGVKLKKDKKSLRLDFILTEK